MRRAWGHHDAVRSPGKMLILGGSSGIFLVHHHNCVVKEQDLALGDIALQS